MVLPGTVFLPHNLLPLHIFEPRYRKMLELCLEGDRIFGVCQRNSDSFTEEPYPVGGVGFVRACVQNDDGTSNLLLQGVSRVRFHDFIQTEPYYIGVPTVIETSGEEDSDNSALAEKLVEDISLIRQTGTVVPNEIENFLQEIKEPEVLADIVAGTFLQSSETKQEILETSNVNQRLKLVDEALRLEFPILESDGE